MEQIGKDPVGPGPTKIGFYIGSFVGLNREAALILPHADDPRLVCAQFHNRSTGLAYGWWAFPRKDFEILDGILNE